MNQPNFRKLVYAVAAVVVVGLLGWIFVLGLQSRDKTAAIDVQSAVPDDINITIDGSKVASNVKVAVKPGDHKIVAERKGFEGQTHNVTVKQGETKTVRLLMTPNGPEGTDWARAHPDQFREYEAKQGEVFTQTSKDLTTKYPLIAHLPELRRSWRVDYGASVAHPKDPDALAIIITYVEGDDSTKQQALDWIKSQGFNPSDYEIIFQVPPAPAG
jgi:hypothetical protein